MSITIKYQTSEQPFVQVAHYNEIPKEATLIWYDFNDPTEIENEVLQSQFKFNKLEIEDTIKGHREQNIRPMKHINISSFIVWIPL